jgi:hypothetical protein
MKSVFTGIFCGFFLVFFYVHSVAQIKNPREGFDDFYSGNEVKLHDLDNNFCIAYDMSKRECFLNVSQFNSWCETFKPYNFPRQIGLDSARKIAVDMCLYKIFHQHHIKKNRLDTVTAFVKEAESAGQFYKKKYIDNNYRALYKKYYNSYFTQYLDPFIRLIGSSDSLVIDSITQRWSKEINDASGKKGKTGTLASTIPYEIACAIDTLKPSDMPKTFATSYGFFVARVADSSTLHREVPLDSAQGILYELSLRENVATYDVKFLRSYYDKHREGFRVPDTFSLQVWLVPGPERSLVPFAYKPTFIEKSSAVQIDTSRLKSLSINQWALPDSIRCAIERYDSLFRLKPFIKMENTLFGTWYIKLKTVNRGNGYVAFRRIVWKNLDRKILEALNKERLLEVEDAFKSHTFANNSRIHERTLVPPPTEKDIQDLVKQGVIDTVQLNAALEDDKQHGATEEEIRKDKKDLIDFKYRDYMVEKEILEWKKGIIIDDKIYRR